MLPCLEVRPSLCLLVIAAALVGSMGCFSTTHVRRANVLEHLYPEGKPASPASVVQLDLPVHVGVAFVPEAADSGMAGLPAQEQALLERARKAFETAEGLGRIEVVPESFVTRQGGFENVRQIRSALGVDLIALISFDQTQFDDPNLASITYWTIAGAYVVPGNENETHTLVYVSVFDIESQALLMNASGESKVEGRTTAMNVERSMREDRVTGFELAVDDMIQHLDDALRQFREQVKSGTLRGKGTPAVEVTSAARPSEGSTGVGGLGPLGLVLGALFFLVAPPVRRRAGPGPRVVRRPAAGCPPARSRWSSARSSSS